MAGTVTPQDVADLVASILPQLGRMSFEQIAQNLQDYPVMRHWLRKDKITFDNGIAVRKNLLSQTSGAASHVGLMDLDDVNIPDLMDDIVVPWRFAVTKWAYEYRSDMLMNTGESSINDLVKARRLSAMIDLATELEAKAWQVPNTTDKTNPYGVPYWIVFNAAGGVAGFNGGYPTGPDLVPWTTIGGLNLTETPNFKNYCAQYANVTKDDLIPKMRTGLRRTGFMSPVTADDLSTPRGNDRRYYINEVTCTAFENIGEAQNENLGRDVAPFTAGNGGGSDINNFGGMLSFKKHPLIWIPQLDDTATYTAATNPIYQIDHDVFSPICLKGDFLREGKPEKSPNQHNVWRVFVDLTYNFVCKNRRRCAVYAQ